MGLLDGIGMAIDLTEGICNVLRKLDSPSGSQATTSPQQKKTIVVGSPVPDFGGDEDDPYTNLTPRQRELQALRNQVRDLENEVEDLEDELEETKRNHQREIDDAVDDAVKKEHSEHVIIITDM